MPTRKGIRLRSRKTRKSKQRIRLAKFKKPMDFLAEAIRLAKRR